MFVNALRLAGFKSFAAPTVLEFEPGVNVIVGPNGSGKSNIADALSWVLGSQAPSNLRGASMEDVIFAGSAGHPRLGMAEVELTLDNSSGLLALDLAEVTISRSTDRSGASEYRINGAPCRLLDIQELLSDTGIGRSLHTVVGQGQLDQILQARPEERRSFIEEAAQIGKYRRRKDRAVRKIERVDDNLLRLNDVLAELRRTARPLKRQASAAAAYSELVSEHQELKQRLTATEIQRLSIEEAELALADEERRASLLSDELSSVRARLTGAAQQRERLAASADRSQQVVHGMVRATDRLSGLARIASERAERISARLAAETEEGYRERIRLLETERERFGREAARLRAEAAAGERRATDTRSDAEAARTRLDDLERSLGATRSAETEAAQALVRAEGSEAAGRSTIGSMEARVAAVMERRRVAERDLGHDSDAIEAAHVEVQTLEAELDSVTEAAARAEATLEEARAHADGLKDKLGASHADQAAAAARRQTLDEVIALLDDHPAARERIEPLLERARAAEEVASAGEREAAGILTTAEEAVEARWHEVARLDEELRRLDALMSGAAERLGGARRRFEKRETELATLDEELSRVREALAQAERSATEQRAELPGKRAALEQARSRRAEAEARAAEARRAADDASRIAGEAAMDARAAEERVLGASLRLEEAEAGIVDAQRALEGLEDLRSALRQGRDRAERVAEIASFAAERGRAWVEGSEGRASAARDRARAAEQQLNALHERERDLEQRLEEVERKRSDAEVRRAQMRARSEALSERAMEEWGLSTGDLMRLQSLDAGSVEETRARIGELERDMKRIGPVNPRAAEEYKEVAERETFLVDQIEDLKSSRRDLMKIVREVDETIVDVFGKAFEDVAGQFSEVFVRLFPGGEGKLELTSPDDLLSSGIEVEARPAGKNVRKLSLLSGGERSLVALAFLFAIFRARPSPFYLLDEVEAALDDVNLQRFLVLIHELEEHAQVMIVTHQKRTMEAADVLYGVSMAKEGVSLVVAKRMEDAAV